MEDNAYFIDDERLILAVDAMKKKILNEPSQKTTVIRFDEGFFADSERYKYTVYEKCRKILDFENWTPEMLQNTEISDRVLNAFNEGRNLINFYTNLFKEKIDQNPRKAQRVIYDLFRGNDDYMAFQNFTSFFGRQYSKTSFLFFLKNKEKYLPIKPELFRKRLSLLNIETDCTNGLTWDHYMEFIQIIADVQQKISKMFEGPVTLLDAHSFVWRMNLLEKDFLLADDDYKDYSEGIVQITQEQWEDILRKRLLKKPYINTLFKFYLEPFHTATFSRLASQEQEKTTVYIKHVNQMGKIVSEYLKLTKIWDKDEKVVRWWPILFLGRRLLSGGFELRVRPELAEAMTLTSKEEIEKFKYLIEEKRSYLLDSDEVFEKAFDASSQKPKTYYSEVIRIQRNPYITEWVKRRENGVCLLCGNEGPFREDATGRPFLEAHHIIPLSEGGPDSIYNVAALCPNCHRKMHHVSNIDYDGDLKLLKNCMHDFQRKDSDSQ